MIAYFFPLWVIVSPQVWESKVQKFAVYSHLKWKEFVSDGWDDQPVEMSGMKRELRNCTPRAAAPSEGLAFTFILLLFLRPLHLLN